MSVNNNINVSLQNRNEVTQIYNLPEKNQQFFIQFNQLITYHNFSRKLKQALTTGVFLDKERKIENKGDYIQNTFYLIDRKWLEQWKKTCWI